MKPEIDRCVSLYDRLSASLVRVDPPTLLMMRLWVALAFWRAGVVKFDDPSGTAMLFSTVYRVPVLPPPVAAFLGTWVELITPWLLGFGLLARPTAAFLFVYNVIAVISYPDLWPHGFWHGLVGNDFLDHKVWAIMLLAVIARGPGTFSIDAVLRHLFVRARRAR